MCKRQVGFLYNGFNINYDNSFQWSVSHVSLLVTCPSPFVQNYCLSPKLSLCCSLDETRMVISGFYSLWLHKKYEILKVVEVVLFRYA